MTVGRGTTPFPPRDDRRTPEHDDQHESSAPPKHENDERSTTPRDLIGLTGRILGSWGYTTRALVLAGALTAVTFAGLCLAPVDITVGPVHVRGRAHPETTAAPNR